MTIRLAVQSVRKWLSDHRWLLELAPTTSLPASMRGPSSGWPAAAASNSSPPKISASASADLATARREGDKIAVTFHDVETGRLVSYAVAPDVAASLAAAVAFALAKR